MAENELWIEVVDNSEQIQKYSGILGFALYQNALIGKDTDLELKVGPNSVVIQAHAAVLKQMSEFFNTMLSERWKRGEEVDPLPEDDPEDFRMFLKLMYGYTGLKVDDYKDVFPVVRLADYYRSAHVQKVLSDFAEDLAANKLTAANVIPIYLSAKKFGIKIVKDAACEFILENINDLWKDTKWLELDEEALVWILSNDSLCHFDSQTVMKNSSSNCDGSCCPTCSDPKRGPKQRYESENEVLIFRKVMEWIAHRRSMTVAGAGEGPADEEQGDVDGFAMRVLKHVRFSLMNPEDFRGAVREVPDGALTETELNTIVLPTFGRVSGSSKFVSTVKARKLPEVARQTATMHLIPQSQCSRCGNYNLPGRRVRGHNICINCM